MFKLQEQEFDVFATGPKNTWGGYFWGEGTQPPSEILPLHEIVKIKEEAMLNVMLCIPGTQMTLVLIERALFWGVDLQK